MIVGGILDKSPKTGESSGQCKSLFPAYSLAASTILPDGKYGSLNLFVLDDLKSEAIFVHGDIKPRQAGNGKDFYFKIFVKAIQRLPPALSPANAIFFGL